MLNMNTTIHFKNLFIFAAILALSLTAIPALSVSAQTKTEVKTSTSTTVKKTEPVSVKEEDKLVNTEKVEEVSTGVWISVKNWFIGLYNKVDAWRMSQGKIWTDIKNEKEAEVAERTQTVDTNRDNRVNRILNEEQTSLFNGSGADLKGDGNIFLLRLYTFALFIFVIIFTTPIIFYGIIILVVIAILNKIIQKIRNPHAY